MLPALILVEIAVSWNVKLIRIFAALHHILRVDYSEKRILIRRETLTFLVAFY